MAKLSIDANGWMNNEVLVRRSKRILALHGFLGSPADFKPLALSGLYAPSIFNLAPTSFSSWLQRFLQPCPAIIMGYSMGGRIALHALVDNPNQFKAAIIIAAHPGLKSEQERAQRRECDRQWAERFRQEAWNDLMHAWNQQPVLRSSRPRFPRETDFSRTTLAHYLRYFSLAEQEYLTPRINNLDIPILWLTPACEEKAIAGLRLKHPQSKLVLINEVGHRFLVDNPDLVSSCVSKFLAGIN